LEKSLASKKKKQQSFNLLLDFFLFFTKQSQPLSIQEGEYSLIEHFSFYEKRNNNNSAP